MELFFLPFILIPVIVVCVFVFVIGKGIAQWSHNNSQPVLTSNAKKGGLIEEHHLLPDANEFKAFWSRSDIDIDIEDFKIAIDVVTHRGADVGLHSTGWNDEWRAFLLTSPTRKQVFDFAKDMVSRYAIN